MKNSWAFAIITTVMSTTALAGPSQYNAALSATPGNTRFGIGAQVGTATGVSAKMQVTETSAFVLGFGAGWSWGFGSGLELSLGYVVHPTTIADMGAVRVSWYTGGAIDVLLLQGEPLDFPANQSYVIAYAESDTKNLAKGYGFHVPIGLDVQIPSLSLSLFVEAAPGMDVFPLLSPRLGGALGTRVFF